MKQNFSKKDFTIFKQIFDIKKNSTQIENYYYKKTYKYLKFIKWIPGILMIGIGNSISMNAAKKSSDIDLFIVTKENRMWFYRILITIIFQILGVRKNSKKHAQRFCLSFFATEKGMNFGDFALENDIYLYFWIIYFKPLLDYNNTYDKFIKINETWACFDEYKDIINENKKYIKYKKPIPLRSSTSTSPKLGRKNLRNFIQNFLDYIDKILKNIFIKKTMKNFEKLGKPYGIIINENILKFHNNDIRKKVKNKFSTF